MRASKTKGAGGAAAGRRRVTQLQPGQNVSPFDYDLLRKCMTEHGKIMPSRFTGATPRQQRQIARAIRRARVMGILR